MAISDSQIDKPQNGRPKRAELPDVNINTGAQSINTERAVSVVYIRNFELLEIRAKRYLISKRNSEADCRMLYEARKQLMAWIKNITDYKYRSKDTHFRWKIKWQLRLLRTRGIMNETVTCVSLF